MIFLPATTFTAGISSVILTFHTINVIRLRRSLRVAIGDGTEEVLLKLYQDKDADVKALFARYDPLKRAIRIHANFVEYLPVVLILLGLCESSHSLPHWLTKALAAYFVIGRLFHYYGLSNPGPSLGRVIGMTGTISLLFTCSVALLVHLVI